jgi:hypothetical protein
VDFRGDPEYRVKTANRKIVLKMGKGQKLLGL